MKPGTNPAADIAADLINPWETLPAQPPFLLINDFDNYRVLPVPYCGDPSKARLVLLLLNPGFDVSEVDLMADDPYFAEQHRKSLTFESEVPFWPLDPRLRKTPAAKYWTAKLRWLIDALGLAFVQEHTFCAEFFPYHSKYFVGPYEPVPSQAFVYELVRRQLGLAKPVVLMRSRREWESAIPELVTYANRFQLKGRNAALSPGNMDGFDRLVAMLRSA